MSSCESGIFYVESTASWTYYAAGSRHWWNQGTFSDCRWCYGWIYGVCVGASYAAGAAVLSESLCPGVFTDIDINDISRWEDLGSLYLLPFRNT